MLIDAKAPDFDAVACFPDNSFKNVKLSDYQGKHVILFFYPADFTFVCASEVPGFNKLLKEFDARNVAVLGCSTDTEHAHKGWKLLPTEMGGIGQIGYPIISDKTKEIAAAYDVLQPDGLCCRGLFLIDKEGFVRAEHKNCDPLGRNLDEALRLVDALQFHEKSKAEGNTKVCPASWKLGKKGLTPKLEAVGQFNAAGELNDYVS